MSGPDPLNGAGLMFHPLHLGSKLLALGAPTLVLALSGCAHSVDPRHASVDVVSVDFAAISELVLTRRVIGVESTARTNTYGVEGEQKSISDSRFGGVGQIADPTCITDGITRTFPAARIIPTATFWTLTAPERDAITLGEALRQETGRRLTENGVQVLIAAYHRRVDLESAFVEGIVAGGAKDRDRETAAVAVFDVGREKVLSIERLEYEDETSIAHIFVVIPLGAFTTVTTQPCEGVGARAGEALTRHFGGESVGLVVVATESDPYAMAR